MRTAADRIGRTASAVLIGLALSGCEKDGPGTVSPEPVADDGGDVGEPEYGVADDGGMPEPEPLPEPEPEPDYGVAASVDPPERSSR